MKEKQLAGIVLIIQIGLIVLGIWMLSLPDNSDLVTYAWSFLIPINIILGIRRILTLLR